MEFVVVVLAASRFLASEAVGSAMTTTAMRAMKRRDAGCRILTGEKIKD